MAQCVSAFFWSFRMNKVGDRWDENVVDLSDVDEEKVIVEGSD